MRNKKILVLTAILTLFLAGLVSADCPPEIAGYWKFDENPQTHLGTVSDSSGNGSNGIFYTNQGSTNKAVAGAIESALSFDGIDDYISVADNPTLNPANQLTVEAWVKPAADNKDLAVIIKKSDATQRNGYTLEGSSHMTGQKNTFRFGIYNGLCLADNQKGTSFGWCITGSTPSLTAGEWHHLAATYNGSELNLYLDGALIPGATVQVLGAIIPSSNNLMIGKDPSNPSAVSRFFKGGIDEVALYDHSLTAEEVYQLYQNSLGGRDYCETTCSCSSGPCCDGCNYLPAGTDCGLCAVCDGNGGGIENCVYDETQDTDCSATECPDSCNINSNPFDWDYAEDVPNECVAKGQCSQNECSYGHECRDNDANDGLNEVCGAECDQDGDCSATECDDFDGCVGNDYYDYSDVDNNCVDCACENNACGAPTIHYNDGRCVSGCPADMKGYWKLDENPQTHLGAASDSSGNGNTGTFYTNQGSTNKAVAGAIESALSFDGIDDYIYIADEPTLNPTTGMAIGAWINPSANNNDIATIFKKSDNLQKNGYSLEGSSHITKKSNTFRFALYTGDNIGCPRNDAIGVPAGWCVSGSTPPLEAGKWHYIVAVYDGEELKLYLNGEIILGATSKASGNIISSSDSLMIGKDPSNPSAVSRFFKGGIDEVALYGHSLTAEEVYQLYQNSLGGKGYCESPCSCSSGPCCDGCNYLPAGADCGICAECDGNGASEENCVYDEMQDNDCSATECHDSCNINSNPFDWDYADDAANECVAKGQCSQRECSYGHECRDNDANDGLNEVCGAECDQDSDCSATECDDFDGCVGNDYYDYSDVDNNCVDCACENNACGAPTIHYNDGRCIECQMDEECCYLNEDYCDGDIINHQEGICVNYECQTEIWELEDCNNYDNYYCDGSFVKGEDYTCGIVDNDGWVPLPPLDGLGCVLEDTLILDDCYYECFEGYCIPCPDPNGDGIIDDDDLTIVSQNYGSYFCAEPEWCNGADVNRDGMVDIFDLTTVGSWHGKTCEGIACLDEDNDGYYDIWGGDCPTGDDCNDDNANIHPGADEICDNLVDDDCDGLIDLDDSDCVISCADSDGDGYEDESCGGNDCNDNDNTVYPGAPELCDGKDNNCNGMLGDTEVDYDKDGYMVCNGDCNDGDSTTYPGAPELDDGKDNDCDGLIDEGIFGSFIALPRESLFISKIRTNQMVYDNIKAGDQLFIDLNFENIGRHNMRYATIRVTVPELGISRKLGPFSGPDADDAMSKGLYLDIPEDAKPGVYTARISLSDLSGIRRTRHRDFRIVE